MTDNGPDNAVAVEEVKAPEPVVHTPEQEELAAREAIDFVKEQAPEFLCAHFWETVRDLAVEEGGLQELKTQPTAPVILKDEPEKQEVVEPMKETQVKSFSEELLPHGQYVGQKVSTVYKKDKDHLELIANRPSLFQSQMKKYLAYMKLQGKPRRKSNKKPAKSPKKTAKKK